MSKMKCPKCGGKMNRRRNEYYSCLACGETTACNEDGSIPYVPPINWQERALKAEADNYRKDLEKASLIEQRDRLNDKLNDCEAELTALRDRVSETELRSYFSDMLEYVDELCSVRKIRSEFEWAIKEIVKQITAKR